MTAFFPENRIKAAFYLLFRNDVVWASLSQDQKKLILRNNDHHNTQRADYADARSFDPAYLFESSADRSASIRGLWLERFLTEFNPRSIIEFGPGTGYFTRMIVEHPSVEQYHAVDINKVFLDFLEPRLREMAKRKKNFSYSLYHENFLDVRVRGLDCAIFLSCVHHIPNREALFDAVWRLLASRGLAFCIEPTHYLPRHRHLIRKILKPGYLDNLVSGKSITATHHFCTLGEFRRLARRDSHFQVVRNHYHPSKTLVLRAINKCADRIGLDDRHWLRRTPLHRLLSREMMIVLEKR